MPHLLDQEIDTNEPAFLYLNLHAGEEIKIVVRHHWAGFIGTLFLTFMMALFPLLLIFAGDLTLGDKVRDYYQVLVVAVSGYYLFLATFLFGSWINYYYDVIFVTNERILNVDQEGLLARKVSELSLLQVQDVTAQMGGFIQSFFNFGLIVIETAGEGTADDPHRPGLQGYFTVRDLPDPNRLARIILELHRQVLHEQKQHL